MISGAVAVVQVYSFCAPSFFHRVEIRVVGIHAHQCFARAEQLPGGAGQVGAWIHAVYRGEDGTHGIDQGYHLFGCQAGCPWFPLWPLWPGRPLLPLEAPLALGALGALGPRVTLRALGASITFRSLELPLGKPLPAVGGVPHVHGVGGPLCPRCTSDLAGAE